MGDEACQMMEHALRQQGVELETVPGCTTSHSLSHPVAIRADVKSNGQTKARGRTKDGIVDRMTEGNAESIGVHEYFRDARVFAYSPNLLGGFGWHCIRRQERTK